MDNLLTRWQWGQKIRIQQCILCTMSPNKKFKIFFTHRLIYLKGIYLCSFLSFYRRICVTNSQVRLLSGGLFGSPWGSCGVGEYSNFLIGAWPMWLLSVGQRRKFPSIAPLPRFRQGQQ